MVWSFASASRDENRAIWVVRASCALVQPVNLSVGAKGTAAIAIRRDDVTAWPPVVVYSPPGQVGKEKSSSRRSHGSDGFNSVAVGDSSRPQKQFFEK